MKAVDVVQEALSDIRKPEDIRKVALRITRELKKAKVIK
jgi:hypothetical protein